MEEISIKIDDELYRRASRKVADLEAEINQHVTEYLEGINSADDAILDARSHMEELFRKPEYLASRTALARRKMHLSVR